MITFRPTPPQPTTATVLPGWTWAEKMTAPKTPYHWATAPYFSPGDSVGAAMSGRTSSMADHCRGRFDEPVPLSNAFALLHTVTSVS